MIAKRLLCIIIIISSLYYPTVYSAPDWTIDGAKVFVDTSAVYLSAEPHTIYGSGWVEFNLVAKQFTGDADVVWGFNLPTVKPTKAQIWRYHEVQTSNITTEWVWGWVKWAPDFEKKSFDRADMNTWYLLKGIPVIATNEYKVRIFIDIAFSEEPVSGKYVWGIKRSQDTIQDAYILDPWYNAEWAFRETAHQESDYINEDLDNFPVLIHHNLTNYVLAQADGDDILFTDFEASKLDHEIERYDSATGELWAWVRVNLTDASDTEINLYYGNPNCADQSNTEGVWDDNFVGVWHYPEASGTVYDSTRESNDGSSTGVDYQQPGMIDYALYYDGSTEDVNYGDVDLNGTDATMEAWMNLDSHSGWEYAIGKNWKYYLPSDGTNFRAGFNDVGGFTTATSATAVVDDTWFYVAGTHEDTDGAGIKVFVDGSEDGSAASNGAIVADASNLLTGASSEWGDEFQGWIDEVRLSNSLRSEDWINATYHSISTSAFIYWATVETVTHSFTVTTTVVNTVTTTQASSNTTEDISLGTFWTTYTGGTSLTSCYTSTLDAGTSCVTGTETTSTGIMQTVTVSVDETVQEIQTINEIVTQTIQVDVTDEGASTLLPVIAIIFATIVILIVMKRRH